MMLSSVSMSASKPASLLSLAERLTAAIKAEGRDGEISQNEFERQAGLKAGQLSNYARGNRGGSTIAVDKLRALADVLHVTFDWLAFGEGPMRKGGRDTTPAEEAMTLARKARVPEAVWQSTWDRYKDQETTMTALDWAVAIHNEALFLARSAAQKLEKMGALLPPAGVDASKKMPSRRPSKQQ